MVMWYEYRDWAICCTTISKPKLSLKMELLAFVIKIEIAYSSHSYWHCSCDWTVNSAATAIKIEMTYCFDSYWYCNCDWIVNRTAIANEIEVAYSFHSYQYCYCDWIVNSTATTIKTEIVFSRHYNRYCSCNWTLYVAAVAIETDIEFPIFQQLKLKLILNSVLWGYCYCGRSRTTLKKWPKSYQALKKGIVQPWGRPYWTAVDPI